MCIVLYCIEMCVLVQATRNNDDFEPITDMMVVMSYSGVSVIAVRLSRLLHIIPTRLIRESENRLKRWLDDCDQKWN